MRNHSIGKFYITRYGGVAQLGEHLPCKQGVMSSNLSISIDRRKQSGCICTLKTSYRIDFDKTTSTASKMKRSGIKLKYELSNQDIREKQTYD